MKRYNVLETTRDTRSKVEWVLRSQAECLWTQVDARLHRTRMSTTVQAARYLHILWDA